jgi:hypothetical protein
VIAANLIQKNVFHAGLSKPKISQVSEHEPPKGLPVISNAEDNTWKLAMVLLVNILPTLKKGKKTC